MHREGPSLHLRLSPNKDHWYVAFGVFFRVDVGEKV